jgi:hypothetical protein
MAQQVVLPPHRICDPLEDPPGTVVKLPIGDLQLADVILSYTEGGDGLLVPSWWVRFLDQGCYSHAALYDGQGCVIEARSPTYGVVRSPLRNKPYQYADVFRYQWADGAGPDVARVVVETAETLLGKGYDKGNVILTGLLAITRRVDLPGGLEDSLRTVLDAALSSLTEIVRDGRDFLTCAELVYRAFSETGNRIDVEPLHPRSPEVIEAVMKEAAKTAKSPPEAAIQAQLTRFADLYLGQRSRHRAGLMGRGKAANVPDFITPLDLQLSSSLERVGRLDLGVVRSSTGHRPAAGT